MPSLQMNIYLFYTISVEKSLFGCKGNLLT